MSKLFQFVSSIINFIHVLLIIYILTCPFFCYGLNCDIFYLVFVPFVFLHWIFNNDDCALTVLENYFRGQDIFSKNKNNNFMYNLVSPVFNLPILMNRKFIYITLFILYIIKICTFCNNIKNNRYHITI